MMMKAVQITSYDGPLGTLEYGETSDPTPAAGQIAINVHYAGASYVEALFAGGFVPTIPVPWVPGLEASGTVRAHGEGVTEHDGLEIGTPVAAFTVTDSGGYGQIAVTNAHLVAPIPEGLDAATAAAVPANTTAALIALERLAQVQSGQSVLVQAAAGGLGSQLGQVARYLGASRVVGVVGSEQKRHAALELGYDEVILRDDLAEQEPDQFDIIVDPVGGPTRARCVDLLRVGGRLLVVGDAAQAGDQLISSNDLWLGGKSVMGFNLGALTAAQPELVGTYLRRALQLVADGEVKVQVTDVVPITQAPSVLARLRAGSTVGKTALKHGVVVAGHTARQLTPEMCNAADLILVMEPAHIDMVADILPSARGKTILLAQWLPKKNIPDPFKQSSEMFEAVFQQIQSAAETWAEKLNGPTPA